MCTVILEPEKTERSENGFVVIGLYFPTSSSSSNNAASGSGTSTGSTTRADGGAGRVADDASRTADEASSVEECQQRQAGGCATSGMGAIFIQAACLGFAPDAQITATVADDFWTMPKAQCESNLADKCFDNKKEGQDSGSQFLELDHMNLASYHIAGRAHQVLKRRILILFFACPWGTLLPRRRGHN